MELGRAQQEVQSQNRLLLLAGKAPAKDLEGWLLPSHSKCLDDWECGPDRAHSTG